MAGIIDFRTAAQTKIITSLTEEAWGLGEVLAEPSREVSRILHTSPTQILVLNVNQLEEFIFDELFQRTKDGREITPEYILTLKYIAERIGKLYQSETNDGYVSDALEQGDYKLAGDNAVMGHIHFVGKRKNPLTKMDYVHLAEQCYYRWYEKHPNSLGYVIASHVRGILEKIENWNADMMKRVPAFSVIPGRV